jgi:sugar lactone lactonase YvrE
LRFCSNVTETSDGTMYFTESTSRFHYEYYKGAIMEARGSGSLFRRDTDGAVTRLLSGLYFANGVTLTADESALVVAETQGARVSKYWLTGRKREPETPWPRTCLGIPTHLDGNRRPDLGGHGVRPQCVRRVAGAQGAASGCG